MENDDLLLTRLNAHMRYVAPRIYKEEKRKEFILTMLSFIDGEQLCGPDKHGGVALAVDIYNDICDIHLKRFVVGRSEDFYMERL
jgi:hypothetical protein